MFSFLSQLQSAVAQVVEENLPERIFVVINEWRTGEGPSQEEILGFGDRSMVRGIIKHARYKGMLKVSSGERSELHFVFEDCYSGFEDHLRIIEVNRENFLGLILNPALGTLLKRAAASSVAKE